MADTAPVKTYVPKKLDTRSRNDKAYDKQWKRVMKERHNRYSRYDDYDSTSGRRAMRVADEADTARKRRNLVPTLLHKY